VETNKSKRDENETKSVMKKKRTRKAIGITLFGSICRVGDVAEIPTSDTIHYFAFSLLPGTIGLASKTKA
jgi:hypothetical protein